MREPSSADLYLGRLAGRAPYRWTIYTVFTLTATAILYERIDLGRADQVLPWYTGALALYGFGMAAASRLARSRIVYFCFGLLVAAAFSRSPLAGWTRLTGLIELAACVALLLAFAGLSSRPGGPARISDRNAMLESGTSHQHVKGPEQEDLHG